MANAPYVPTDAIALMPPWKPGSTNPRVALDGGGDGLRLVRRVVAEAPRWLATGGHLLVESSRAQAPTVVAECGVAGLSARVMTSAERDATVVVATAHSR